MASPPSYEEIASSCEYRDDKTRIDALGTPQRLSIREEIGTSRSQHVAAIVAKLVPHVRARARAGLSKSTLVLLPSNQDSTSKGQLVGHDEDETPIIVQLESAQDHMEFWAQEAALRMLQEQFLAAISIGSPVLHEAAIPTLPDRPPPNKSSWFSRKQSKATDIAPTVKAVKASVTVKVFLDEAHFRSENEYGLYQTLRGRCIFVTIEIS